MTARRVVVVGASGSVGTALLRLLETDRPEWEVIGLCRRPPPPAVGETCYRRVRWRAADISRPAAVDVLADVMSGADAVVHAAWAIQPSRDPALLDRTNVLGTSRVLDAARATGVGHVVYLSSVGAYAPADKHRVVDESWPATGVRTSMYSRHTAAVETRLDAYDAVGGGPTVTRLRPGLIFQRDAASEVARYFLGPLVPQGLLGRLRLPVLPVPALAVFQVVHAYDVARAVVASIERRVAGPVNLAAEPVVTPSLAASWLGARLVQVPPAIVRAAAAATYRARMQRTEPGWVDLTFAAPVMSIERARGELGWVPTVGAREALAELFAGMRERAGTASAPMRPRRRLPRALACALPGRLSRDREGSNGA